MASSITDHIYWKDGILYLLDQRVLPFKNRYVRCRAIDDVANAITKMVIRGAPLIGIVAAYGVVIGVKEHMLKDKGIGLKDIERIIERLAATRPTAVNLFWALDRMKRVCERYIGDPHIIDSILDEAISIHVEDIENNRMLALFGAELIEDGDTILTHCNAGALATGGYGTALGVIRAAFESGKGLRVIATETRPYMQGARLTAWELHRDGIDVELVPDNHVGLLCYQKMVDKVIVGADRIAINGDTANKIGTYMIALSAYSNQIPFFVAATSPAFDKEIADGDMIPIEERDGRDVKRIGNSMITIEDIPARYLSFDITPERLISKFITEKGIVERPFKRYIKML